MLQRNIDVASDFVASRDGVDKFIAPMRRVRIKQTHPEVPLGFLDFAKKAGKRWPAHLWNHAKTARMIAALRNLYIGGMRGRKPEARRIVIGDVGGPRVCECQI